MVQLWLSWCMMIKMDQMTLWQIIYFHLAFHKYASLSHKCEMLVLLFIQPFARITVNEIPFGPTPTKLFTHWNEFDWKAMERNEKQWKAIDTGNVMRYIHRWIAGKSLRRRNRNPQYFYFEVSIFIVLLCSQHMCLWTWTQRFASNVLASFNCSNRRKKKRISWPLRCRPKF